MIGRRKGKRKDEVELVESESESDSEPSESGTSRRSDEESEYKDEEKEENVDPLHPDWHNKLRRVKDYSVAVSPGRSTYSHHAITHLDHFLLFPPADLMKAGHLVNTRISREEER